MTKTRTTYRARLCNSAGELDMLSADDLEILARHLGKRLIGHGGHQWLLADGDVIRIDSGEVAAS